MTTDSMIPIDPARPASGTWSHRLNRTVGESDISASASADRIGMGEPIRPPFAWRGAWWTSVDNRSCGGRTETEAYRLSLPSQFDGIITTYAVKAAGGDEARSVKHGGGSLVLCGPPVTFVPGEPEQASLF